MADRLEVNSNPTPDPELEQYRRDAVAVLIGRPALIHGVSWVETTQHMISLGPLELPNIPQDQDHQNAILDLYASVHANRISRKIREATPSRNTVAPSTKRVNLIRGDILNEMDERKILVEVALGKAGLRHVQRRLNLHPGLNRWPHVIRENYFDKVQTGRPETFPGAAASTTREVDRALMTEEEDSLNKLLQGKKLPSFEWPWRRQTLIW